MKPRTPFALLLLAIFATSLEAETITGQVIDANGLPVQGVDIDVDNLGSGGDPDIFNDGTGPDGFFTTTVTESGVFTIRFTPQPPPTSTALPMSLPDVLVVGTVDLGVIQLPPGVAVGGQVVDVNGLPVAQVNIDVRDANGVQQIVTNDRTDAFGNFQVTVPQGQATVELHTATVVGPTLVPRRFPLATPTDVDLGTVVLDPGFRVTGTLLLQNGLPAVAIDMDAFDRTTGAKLFTPDDNTDAFGAFDIVVPGGLFDFEWCPSLATRLVAADAEGIAVAADTALGVFTLESGSLVSGLVTDSLGNPVAGVDLEVRRTGGSSVVTCGDDTDLGGFYQVALPNAVLDLTFDPPGEENIGARGHRLGVPITADRVLNLSLPDCPKCGFDLAVPPADARGGQTDNGLVEPTINYGVGLAGSGGLVPHLGWEGADQPTFVANRFRLVFENALGGGTAFLASSLRPAAGMIPGGGLLLIDPNAIFLSPAISLSGPAGVPGAGFATFEPNNVPASAIGLRVYSQYSVLDPASPIGVSLSEGLRFRVLPQ